MGSKGKTKICYGETWQDQVKVNCQEPYALLIGFHLHNITFPTCFVILFFLQDALAVDPGNPTVLGSLDSVDPLKSSTSGSTNSNNLNSSNSDISCHDDDEDGNGAGDDDGFYDDDDYVSDYDENDNFLYNDGYTTMQSQFDNVDLPPGVEAPLPWLKDPASSANIPASTKTLTISDLPESKRQAAATSSSTSPAESSSKEKVLENEDAVMEKVKLFKQFDVVDDYSDHHYSRMGFSDSQVT
jgi:ubiquitin-conjugating enzyme E2 O